MLKTRLRSRLASRLTTLPSAVVYDVDALDYFTRAEALGGSFDQTTINATYTDTYVKTAFNDYVLGLKSDNVWSKVTELYMLTGVSFGGLMAKLKYDTVATLTNNGFVAGDLVAAGSGAGTKKGSSKDMLTNFDHSTQSASSFGMHIYRTEAEPTTAHTHFNFNSNSQTMSFLAESGVLKSDMFSTVSRISFTETTGMFSAVRTGTGKRIYTNGSFSGSATDTGLIPTASKLYNLGTAYRDTLYASTQSITDAEASNLSTRTNALMTALGANVY